MGIKTTEIEFNGQVVEIPQDDLDWFIEVKGAKVVGDKLSVEERLERAQNAETIEEVNNYLEGERSAKVKAELEARAKVLEKGLKNNE